jgi:hypothetical protein
MAYGASNGNSLEYWRLQRLPYLRNVRASGKDYDDGFLYRPRQLLVAEEHHKAVRKVLGDEWDATPLDVPGVRRYVSRSEIDIPQLVANLRANEELREELGSVPLASPTHVLTGEPGYQGCPGDWPTPLAKPDDDRFKGELDEDSPLVAVLDTGYTKCCHPTLDERFGRAGPPVAKEMLDGSPNDYWRDFAAGHATLILGVVAEKASHAMLRLERVLDSEGYTDEYQVATAIVGHADADVISLSLGGFSFGDDRPIALERAVQLVRENEKTVILAAAGNAGVKDRQFWPAHLDAHRELDDKVVFAVGATSADDSGRVADYSNEPADFFTSGVAEGAFVWFDEKQTHGNPVNGRAPHRFTGGTRWEGTSFATPIVAARIATSIGRGGDARAAAQQLWDDSAQQLDGGKVV